MACIRNDPNRVIELPAVQFLYHLTKFGYNLPANLYDLSVSRDLHDDETALRNQFTNGR